MSMQARRNALYRSVEARVLDLLAREGVPATTGQRLAAGVVDVLSREWGGQVISFPRNLDAAARQRRTMIAGQFDGSNYAELATQFGYTERHIRKIIKRVALETQRSGA